MPTLARPGVTLHYTVEGKGEPILFIQGVGIAGEGWRPQLDAFGDRYTVIAYDNRGLGKSVPCAGEISIEAMAEDAAAVLEAAGFASAHVVGHSMGGVIAQELALAHRAKVRSLALLQTLHRGPAAVHFSGRILWLGIRTRVGTAGMRRRAFVDMVYPKSVCAKVDRDAAAAELGRLAGRDLAESPAILMQQIGAMRRHDKFARLGELAGIPTLVASADEDPIALPAFGERLAGAIPGARYALLEDASHAAPIHDAPRVNRLLQDFWASVAPASPVS